MELIDVITFGAVGFVTQLLLDLLLIGGVWFVVRRRMDMEKATTQRSKVAVYLRLISEVTRAVADAVEQMEDPLVSQSEIPPQQKETPHVEQEQASTRI